MSDLSEWVRKYIAECMTVWYQLRNHFKWLYTMTASWVRYDPLRHWSNIRAYGCRGQCVKGKDILLADRICNSGGIQVKIGIIRWFFLGHISYAYKFNNSCIRMLNIGTLLHNNSITTISSYQTIILSKKNFNNNTCSRIKKNISAIYKI